MDWNLQHIFTYMPIIGVTINTVFLSPAFRNLLYIISIIAFILGVIFYLASKSSFGRALKKSMIATFFIAGFIYAIHADIGWTRWLIFDFKTYAGLEMEEKLLRMEGGLYEFVREAKRIVDGEYALYSSDIYLAQRTEYFLLPRRKKDHAQYIIVLVDKQSHYDQKTRTFTRNGAQINNVVPVFIYTEEARIQLPRNDFRSA